MRVPIISTLVSLAGAPSTRARSFKQFAMGPGDIEPLTKEVLTLRVAAYEGRLQQLMDSMGIPGEASLSDSAVLKRLQREARDTALSILNTHNDDLRSLINRQPKKLTQREISNLARAWEAERAGWKGKQIALTEGMRGRNQADQDVMKRNGLSPQKRVTPRESGEAKCADLVAQGWKRETDWHVSLPLHPSCIHGWEYRQPLSELVKGKERLWLGDWVDVSAGT